jgi:hypothetical protein
MQVAQRVDQLTGHRQLETGRAAGGLDRGDKRLHQISRLGSRGGRRNLPFPVVLAGWNGQGHGGCPAAVLAAQGDEPAFLIPDRS